MANPGVGNKFLSVNLNKSYGQQSHHQYNHTAHSNSYGSNRSRPGGYSNGGGGGMVVLSRPRSSQKAGPKLSIPPPLNLPSLRKEHERFDSSGSGSVHSGAGISGNRSRPSSSGVGWTKPASTVSVQDKDNFSGEHVSEVADHGMLKTEGVTGDGVYAPPSARFGATGASSAAERVFPPAARAPVLRGEDFPSLRATLSVPNGSVQRQKESLNQKRKQGVDKEFSKELRDSSRLSALVDMRPQVHSAHNNRGIGFSQDSGINQDGSRIHELAQKEEYFPGPLPLVRLSPRSDWADDERDTSHHMADRGRDHGYTKHEAFWDRDFDMPRSVLLPRKPAANNLFSRRGQSDAGIGQASSSEVSKADVHSRDVRTDSNGREGYTWRAASPFPRDGSGAREMINDRNGSGIRPERPLSSSREANKETKFIPPSFRDGVQDSTGRRDLAYEQGAKQPWRNAIDTFSYRGIEGNARDRFSSGHNKYTPDASQNSSASRGSFSSGAKGFPLNDPILSFGREKRSHSKGDKPYLEDPFMKGFGDTGFDGRDPFPATLFGVVKRKKDVLKQTDFHDPVRASFEAELERVQKMQEEERRQIVEEQERALELARREEEERLRLVREQEEQQRRLEEEAREAARRAEQERLEALRRAEELRIAKEEEKHRIIMEEERRKQAAKQKLLELEERIAKRRAEAACDGGNASTFTNEKASGTASEREASKLADVTDWEDGEKMVERITTSASSDSMAVDRSFEINSETYINGDTSSAFGDKGKPVSSWRRDAFEHGKVSAYITHDTGNSQHSPWRDRGRGFPRKELYGTTGFMPSRSHYRVGVTDPSHMDEFSHSKGHRCNVPESGNDFGRNSEVEPEYNETLGDHYGDDGWGQGLDFRSHGSTYSVYSENLYPNIDGNGYPSGRARYSIRQPRVLPPPMASMQKVSYKGEDQSTEHLGPSSFLGNEMQHNHAVRDEATMEAGYTGTRHASLGQPGHLDVQHNYENEEQKLDSNPTTGCESQSSLSVSSPPASPIHLSHDDLDDSADSFVLPAAREGKDAALSSRDKEPSALHADVRRERGFTASGTVSSADDEEWDIDNRERLQEPEEYDEDEDAYQDEDEVHVGDDENLDLAHELEELHLQGEGSAELMDNLVLGFNEGVEVAIPSDDVDGSPGNDSAPITKLQSSLDGARGDGQTFQPAEIPPKANIAASSVVYQESEKEMLMDRVDNSCRPGVSTQQMVSPSVYMASHPPSAHSASAAPSQSELPVKLQFGLFSGPTLIPSPVPAIQIGSIQMPLPLHPQVGQSLPNMQPSQPPIFQFGQLRYTTPVSQGFLSLTPQSMSFVQPSVLSTFTVSHNSGVSASIQSGQGTPGSNLVTDYASENQTGIVARPVGLPYGNKVKSATSLPGRENMRSIQVQHSQAETSNIGKGIINSGSDSQEKNGVNQNFSGVNFRSPSVGGSEGHHVTSEAAYQVNQKNVGMPKAHGQSYGSRGKRFTYTVKRSGSRSMMVSEVSQPESGVYQRRPHRQRTEFRIRENAEKKQLSAAVLPNHLRLGDTANMSGKGVTNTMRNGTTKILVPNKPSKHNESGRPGYATDSAGVSEKATGKELLSKGRNSTNYGEGNLKGILGSDGDVDVPLQSGVVRVFEQPGIEPPSDDDDFIEVRSKKQMLNDRREQREKQIKAISRATKSIQKPHSTSQSSGAAMRSAKISAVGGEVAKKRQSNPSTSGKHNLPSTGASVGHSAPILPLPLAPIGTPAVKSDAQIDGKVQTMRSLQTSALPAVSVEQNVASSLKFEGKTNTLDNAQTSIGTWGNTQNKSVMALTQTQLDEAMKPVSFEPHSSIGDHTSSVSEPSASSSSITAKDKAFSSAASPINSLLAGEKIQFGAVTSPTVLPPSTHAVLHGVEPLGPMRVEHQVTRNLPASDKDCSLFLEKEKHQNEPHANLEDCEAEAEAAASAVAVAAITSDEIGGNPLGPGPVSVADTKIFGGADLDGGERASRSKAEESLSVSLPADLSVETPPISLWPPLASPQNSSSHMMPHFPGGPQHFPFYEMNPMLGAPIFAFGPRDELAPNQSQSQKSNAVVSGPHGTWPQCHSGVDSFYGPPAGFSGPFVSPPGGLPGVQAPPHMVVYNHFAPVGQFGQVGLSFMGTTFIPSGKQPDWKHNPVSSAMIGGEGDVKTLTAQQNNLSVPTSVPHLGPGSSLLPMPSPLAMFDISPFQSSPDMSVQARWSHIPAPPLQSAPLSMSLQHQPEGAPPHFNHVCVDQSLVANRFSEVRTSSPSVPSRNFPVVTDVTVTRLPDELGLADASSSSTQAVVTLSSSLSTDANVSQASASQNNGIGNNAAQSTNTAFKPKNTSMQYGNSSGYDHHRGMGPQRNNSGGEWSHRRSGFHGRNHFTGGEKNFQPVKVKQIYVAKPTSSGAPQSS